MCAVVGTVTKHQVLIVSRVYLAMIAAPNQRFLTPLMHVIRRISTGPGIVPVLLPLPNQEVVMSILENLPTS